MYAIQHDEGAPGMAYAHPDTSRSRDDLFDRIFHPQSVAVIGVSSRGGGFGSGILDSLEAIGFEGRLYAVNARGGRYKGRKLYESVLEIPDEVDFAVIAVPAELVPEVLEECRVKGVLASEILSSGFSETGTDEGKRLEERIAAISRTGIRVIGPNCFGVYCPKSGLTLLPGPDLSRQSGEVAFLSQSGGMAIDLANIGTWLGLRFSKVVSYGNGVDLRETELLDYLGSDPQTRVVGMYIEGVRDARAFLDVLTKVSAVKPVVVLKGGLSDAGARMVASHTGSLGGSRVLWEAALRQAGAVVVDDIWDLAYTLLAFSMLPLRDYRGVCVAGGGGALGVSAGDAAEREGLTLPAFDETVSDRILACLPRPGSSARNPVDAANPFVGPDAFDHVFRIAATDDRIDMHLLIQLLHHYRPLARSMGVSLLEMVPYRELARVLAAVRDDTGKPVVLVMPDYRQGTDSIDIGELIRHARQAFVEHGLPVFPDLSNALRATSRVSGYVRMLRARTSRP